MSDNNFIKISKDCDGILIPSGDQVKLKKGTPVKITQSLGGYFTLYVNGNLVKLDGKDGDAIGQKINVENVHGDITKFDENLIWNQLKTCYDPEIPVNIVDLGLVYNTDIQEEDDGVNIMIQMTLTAPGCGMGPVIADEVKQKLSSLSGAKSVDVELVWEPQWNQDMMSDAAKLQLGLY